MALFTPATLIASISGSLAGTTFRLTRHGAIMSGRARPPWRRSFFQNQYRAALAIAASSWTQQTVAERNTWRTRAFILSKRLRLTGSHALSGRALYFRHALRYDSPSFGVPGFTHTPLIVPATHGVTLDFHVGGPYTIEWSAFPGPWNFIGHVSGAGPLPAPAHTTNENWIAIGFATYPDGGRDCFTELQRPSGLIP